MEYRNERLKEFETYIRNKKVAIIGLGVSNIPLLDYLYNLEARITIFDKKKENLMQLDMQEKIKKYHIKTFTGESYLENLQKFDIIFRSPSCRPDLPEIKKELERGAILTSEIELVVELCPGTVIGITGSDGKTTTTSLIYEIIKQAKLNCYLGGNIGIPLFTRIKEMTPKDIIVLELSSFQLMNMKVSPEIAVITNVTPNHLDIHKSYEEYIGAKENIFKFQNEQGIVVLNYDNEITRKMKEKVKGKIVFFSSKEKIENGYMIDENIIKQCKNGLRRHVVKTKDLHLKGIHNYENICAALAATESLVDIEIATKAIQRFKGVEHRLEFVRDIGGVKWYNDSIGTSPTRTIAGLNSFDEKIVLIAGGYDKHLDYEPLAKPILDNTVALILLGQTSEKIYNCVQEKMKEENKEIPIYKCKSLEECVETANGIAKSGEIVLLSPASAAFDMFKNFAERGKIFKALVQKL